MSTLNLTGRIGMGSFGYDYSNDVTNILNDVAPRLARELGVSINYLVADRVTFQEVISKKERIFKDYGLKSEVLQWTYDLMKNCVGLNKEYTAEERKEFVRWYEAHEENC